jgi:hypothetical protein
MLYDQHLENMTVYRRPSPGLNLWALMLFAIMLLPASVFAGLCGDDVGGVRVACACGDFLVSDAVIVSTDPIAIERCPTDGLILQARATAKSMTLDLGGLSITGSGVGTGLLVSHGGDDGATIIGGPDTRRPGQVVGFGSGLRVRTQRALSALRNIDFRGNTTDGAVLRSHGTKLQSIGAYLNGRDGLRIGGRKLEVDGLHGDGNRRYQINLSSTSAAEAAARAGITEGVHARERLPVRRDPPSMGDQ